MYLCFWPDWICNFLIWFFIYFLQGWSCRTDRAWVLLLQFYLLSHFARFDSLSLHLLADLSVTIHSIIIIVIIKVICIIYDYCFSLIQSKRLFYLFLHWNDAHLQFLRCETKKELEIDFLLVEALNSWIFCVCRHNLQKFRLVNLFTPNTVLSCLYFTFWRRRHKL